MELMLLAVAAAIGVAVGAGGQCPSGTVQGILSNDCYFYDSDTTAVWQAASVRLTFVYLSGGPPSEQAGLLVTRKHFTCALYANTVAELSRTHASLLAPKLGKGSM